MGIFCERAKLLLLGVVAWLVLGNLLEAMEGKVLRVPSTEYPSLEMAVHGAEDGDRILVGPGFYKENIEIKGKSLSLKSTHGPKRTVLDGGAIRSVVIFDGRGDKHLFLEGFTITNGSGISSMKWAPPNNSNKKPKKKKRGKPQKFPDLPNYGGGIYCKQGSVEIKGNIITGNRTTKGGAGLYLRSRGVVRENVISFNHSVQGGGIYIEKCEAECFNNYIFSNWGGSDGGGMYLYTQKHRVMIRGNLFYDNWSQYGAAIDVFGCSPVIEGNTIIDNKGCRAGGVCCRLDGADALIKGNLIQRNWGCFGSGITCLYGASPRIMGNRIVENTTHNLYCIGAPGRSDLEFYGAGILCKDRSSPFIACNIIAKNVAEVNGGGIACQNSSPLIVNNTVFGNVAENSIGGLYCDAESAPQVYNTLFWNNRPGEISGNATLSHCNVEGGWPGDSNMEKNPGFINPDENDFHLSPSSFLRDAGCKHLEDLPLRDFEGDPRAAGASVDIGADEFFTRFAAKGSASLCETFLFEFTGDPLPNPGFLCIETLDGAAEAAFSQEGLFEQLSRLIDEVTRAMPRWYDTRTWNPRGEASKLDVLKPLACSETDSAPYLPLPMPWSITKYDPLNGAILIYPALYEEQPFSSSSFFPCTPIAAGFHFTLIPLGWSLDHCLVLSGATVSLETHP